MDTGDGPDVNRRRRTRAVVLGIVTIVAVCALILTAAFLDLPTAARIVLIVIAVIAGIAGIALTATQDRTAGYFVCPYCGHRFTPTMKEYVKGCQTFTKRRLTCPACRKTGMCRHHTRR